MEIVVYHVTFPQAVYNTTGGSCGCNTGYSLISGGTVCDNASNDMINTVYLPQLVQCVAQLTSYATTVKTVTQTGTINTAVSLNAVAGIIQTVNNSYGTGLQYGFVFNNTYISSNSVVLVCNSGGNGAILTSVTGIASGTCNIMLSNPWTTSEYGAIAVAFFIYTPPSTSMVVQTGSNTTAVTLNSVGGIIQCMSSTVASGGVVTFTLNNSSIKTNSIVFVSNVGGNNWFVPTVAGGPVLVNVYLPFIILGLKHKK